MGTGVGAWGGVMKGGVLPLLISRFIFLYIVKVYVQGGRGQSDPGIATHWMQTIKGQFSPYISLSTLSLSPWIKDFLLTKWEPCRESSQDPDVKYSPNKNSYISMWLKANIDGVSAILACRHFGLYVYQLLEPKATRKHQILIKTEQTTSAKQTTLWFTLTECS